MASTEPEADDAAQFHGSKHSWKFYAVFPGLCFSMLLSALETSVIGTALPTIVSALYAGPLYIWTVNGYFLSMAVVQPLVGQVADIFGRRIPMLVSLALFTLASGLCGGANSIEMLIAARVMQGIGGGGISVLVSIIVADLVPLRYRQKYMSIVMASFALGTFIGPIVAGVIVTTISWRWVFYINLPVAAIALVLIFLFLRLESPRKGDALPLAASLDWLGSIILTAAVVSILIALTWGGTTYSWSSWRILAPLLIGIAGLALFLLHQRYVAKKPTIPFRVYGNRTSILGFALTFLHGIILAWLNFFIPIYFQTLREATPLQSGIDLLPIAICFAPAAMLGGLVIVWTGRYKPPLLAGCCLLPIGAGCLTLLTTETPTAQWAVFEIIAGFGGGLILTTTLPAIQAPLAEADVAAVTATWAFVRSLGMIWGGSIPAAVFNSKVDSLLAAGSISDPTVRALLGSGGAYSHATRTFITAFDDQPVLKSEVIGVYTAALKQTWQVLLAFALITIPIALCVKEIPLRKHLDTQFGLDQGKDATGRVEQEQEVISSEPTQNPEEVR